MELTLFHKRSSSKLDVLTMNVTPLVRPPLDPDFVPAALWNKEFVRQVQECGNRVQVRLAIEQPCGSVVRKDIEILPETSKSTSTNFRFVERNIKFLAWAAGGIRIYFDGPHTIGSALQKHYKESSTGRFDAKFLSRVYDEQFEFILTHELPEESSSARQLGRHLDGNRIGFDLGGSDRKVAALVEGEVVFSEEIAWDPYHKTNPQYHLEGISHSLRRAADHLPSVDAIGGSSAGVFVNNQPRVASIFRGIPEDVFESAVKPMFRQLAQDWNVPLEVINDGDVTALAGSMSLGENAVLGLAMGTSEATGYVNPEGKVSGWLNELAFAPVDYSPKAPVDEWSGDKGCGAQYFSQQAVGRLLQPNGIKASDALSLPEKLLELQELMEKGDQRARKVYQSIGVYLGFGIAHYSDFYNIRKILLLGRVTTGDGGTIIIEQAKCVLQEEFPELSQKIGFHLPNEEEKRHGQAIAAASLPII